MEHFVIKDIGKDGYDKFLIWLSSESLIDHLVSIEKALGMNHSSGTVLIDQLFLTGNEENRFISCEYTDGKLDLKTARIVTPPIAFRKETAQWIHDHYEAVDNSMLTGEEWEKAKRGIAF